MKADEGLGIDRPALGQQWAHVKKRGRRTIGAHEMDVLSKLITPSMGPEKPFS